MCKLGMRRMVCNFVFTPRSREAPKVLHTYMHLCMCLASQHTLACIAPSTLVSVIPPLMFQYDHFSLYLFDTYVHLFTARGRTTQTGRQKQVGVTAHAHPNPREHPFF